MFKSKKKKGQGWRLAVGEGDKKNLIQLLNIFVV